MKTSYIQSVIVTELLAYLLRHATLPSALKGENLCAKKMKEKYFKEES